jgi:hypothetical protein
VIEIESQDPIFDVPICNEVTEDPRKMHRKAEDVL